ncbi:MAG: DUF2905 domain-containing protein [Candidatus Omnitrophica bacterium]|nr:DUF2905 domain-containing protein [Candidatus Omnitrophota bacterium]
MNITALAKIFILSGLLLTGMGICICLGCKIPGLGRLPGDILIKRPNFVVYFPLMTCILMSLVLTFLLNLWLRK